MADEIPASRTSRLDPLSLLWRTLAAPQTLMILLGLLALALVLADLLPQIPSQARSDPQAWLATQPGPSAWRSLVGVLHLFDLYHAFWFRLLLTLTGLVSFVRLADAAELAWRATGRGRWTAATFRFWPRGGFPLRLHSPLSLEAAPAQLEEQVEAHGWRWSEVVGCPVQTMVASRRPLLLWARPIGYAALLAAQIGLAIASAWGWQSAEWQPYPGQSQPVEDNSPLQVRLDSFGPSEGAMVVPGAAESQISWLQGDTLLRQAQVGNGRPATLRGLAVRQLGYTPALKVRGRDEKGRPLAFQEEGRDMGLSEVGIVFPSPQARPLLFLAQQDLFLAFRYETQCDAREPNLYVDLVRSDGSSQETLGVLHKSGSVSSGGLHVEVELTYRPILRIDYRPGMVAVGGGMSLALLALAATWIVPASLVWLTVSQGEGGSALIQLLARTGDEESGSLATLAVALEEAASRGG